MKKIVVSAVILFASIACSDVFAEPRLGAGPESIPLKTGAVPLQFPHWRHQIANNSDCSNCHKADGGKIAGWGKDAAHGLCIPCHDLNEKGPVECKQCHQ